jgi:hypothetical protein
MQSLHIEELPQVLPQLRVGMWIAWYRGRAISAHADARVLHDLMAAEGLADDVWYTHDDDEETAQAAPATAAD